MKQFLGIVLRNQFNLFYRFGYAFIPKSQLVEFDGNITDETKEKIIKQFATTTPFEYDEEYLILHLEKEIANEVEFVQFEIQEIVAVYPLSLQAKTSIESKIDQRIKLEKPIFETVLPLIETEIQDKEVEKAISALWKICKIELPLEKYIDEIGLENIVNGLEFRKHGTKANKIQHGNYWEYLIAYDYYQYFPEGTIRYFYQLGEVFSYYKGKSNGIEGTKVEDLLKQIKDTKFEKILQKFSDDSLPISFVESMKEIGKSKFNPIVVSVLFLKWKTDLSSQDIELLQSSIFHKGKIAFIDEFPNEVRLALILLGAFFGFRKFYDLYYDALNLRFYKNYQEPKKQTVKDEQQEKIDAVSKTDEAVGTVSKEEKQVGEKQPETKDEENLTETTTVEEQSLSTEGNPTEIVDKKQSDSTNTQQDDNEEVASDITILCKKIIEKALKEQSEITLTDIGKKIKEQRGKKVNKGVIERVVKQMEEFEITRIERAKGVKRATGAHQQTINYDKQTK
ncbi:MAG: hypothetical protein LBH84_04970 [Prevotellaceae bacterium]|jgi:hypothetical protein|nr:hypothetical protein [Prevotellaceae bacterium]